MLQSLNSEIYIKYEIRKINPSWITRMVLGKLDTEIFVSWQSRKKHAQKFYFVASPIYLKNTSDMFLLPRLRN